VQPVQRAIWIMLSTLCRVGELLMARWEHVNLETGEWFIPRQNVKGESDNLEVYLSAFALNQFRQLHDVTGESEWCFPAKNKLDATSTKDENRHVCVKSVSKQVGDRQTMFKKTKDGGPRQQMKNRAKGANVLVLGDGKTGAWTPHDLRRTGATLMQGLGVPLDIIDYCMNHVVHGSKVRKHYLHHKYNDEKRDAWRLLGERLDLIIGAADNVVPLVRTA
jgi:integrase